MVKLIQTDERLNVLHRNKIVAYVENDLLYAFNKSGYAELVGEINHRVEITGKLKEWLKK